MICVRFTIQSRDSAKRIKLHEESKSFKTRLASVLGKVENGVEDFFSEIAASSPAPASVGKSRPVTERDSDEEEGDTSVDLSLAPTGTHNTSLSEDKLFSLPTTPPNPTSSAHPDHLTHGHNTHKLRPAQLKMIRNLNSLPNMRKFFVYVTFTRNTHAVIICRQAEEVPERMKGMGVLRHWAREWEV